MKHKNNLLIIPTLIAAINLLPCSFGDGSLGARENVNVTNVKLSLPPSILAPCASGTAQTDLAVNNVRCRILTGDMWWDLSNGLYEIPKGSGVHSVFAGALWIGGIDAGGQLKVAAQTYRQTGTDFWPGPLDGGAAITDAECLAYDKHYRVTRKEVEDFVAGQAPASQAILNWPGNGNTAIGQLQYLAPFEDINADGIYDPNTGDYPKFDLNNVGCTQTGCIPNDQLYGDEAIWWVFNDKGDIHSETGGQAIGVEIRGQAFGYTTNDEINNMTFYNYRIYNRSTLQVDSCYMGVWVDSDLGCYTDDYVGCDVEKGLGYTYNGDNDDEVACASKGYGLNPPAFGIDFFRGPIADVGDGKDNNRDCFVDEACEQILMSSFLYYNNDGTPQGNPNGAPHFYNYLTMTWGDGTPVVYDGKDGVSSTPPSGPPCNFMFPGSPSTDKHDFGIGGTCATNPTLAGWDEVSSGNLPADRRMLLSAGPFTLTPGALNVITTGAVWARATSGGATASVNLLKFADIKAQALFDNCFRITNGPDAPDITIQEMNNKLILYLTNSPTSNNYKENYAEVDPYITSGSDTAWKFEGYKIYQVKNGLVSATDLENADKARLIGIWDIKNGVTQIINHYIGQDPMPTTWVAVEEVGSDAKDAGIVHSIPITTDLFSTGSPTLVNHKTYYFMAMAYGYNPGEVSANPYLPTGYNIPYVEGRRNIKVYAAIPHISDPESGGTEMHSSYGDKPYTMTRIEGRGNGGNVLELSSSSVSAIVNAPYKAGSITYVNQSIPVNIKVIDPLNVMQANYTLWFDTTFAGIGNNYWSITNNTTGETINSDRSIAIGYEQMFIEWGLSINIEQTSAPGSQATPNGYLTSSMSSNDWLTGVADVDAASYKNWIRSGTVGGAGAFEDDYLGFDDDGAYEGVVGGIWAPYRLCATSAIGIPASTKYYAAPGWNNSYMNQTSLGDLASVDIVFTSDKSKWTRCMVLEMCEDSALSEHMSGRGALKMNLRRAASVDKNGNPAVIGSGSSSVETDANYISDWGMGWFPGYAINLETGERLNMAFGENSALTGAYDHNGRDMKWNPTSTDFGPNPWDASGSGPVFGGQHYIYVFGHNKENDPPPTPVDTMNVPRYDAGQRMVSLMKLGTPAGFPSNTTVKKEVIRDAMWVNIPLAKSGVNLSNGIPPSDVTVKIRVSKPYASWGTGTSMGMTNVSTPNKSLVVGKSYWVERGPLVHNGVTYVSGAYFLAANDSFSAPTGTPAATPASSLPVVQTAVNSGWPKYTFDTDGLEPHTDELEVAENALDLIKVVPNPYYAYSAYEKNSLDNRVKITNLPEKCTISIYNLSGTLIKKFNVGNPPSGHEPISTPVTTNANTIVISTHDGSLDWDMKNNAGIPISSGVYVIHVDVPNVGEKIVKWFGIMRPIDLDSF